jgi:uncharacterized protein YjiS (DUF1127 family)
MRFPLVVPYSQAPARGLEVGLGAIARLVWARIRAWMAKQSVLAELHDLDQRTLNDLRITPGDFEAIAEGTYRREVPWENAPMAMDLAKVARFSVDRPFQYY